MRSETGRALNSDIGLSLRIHPIHSEEHQDIWIKYIRSRVFHTVWK